MKIEEIEITKIYPNWFQPRKEWDKEKIKELAESILSNGLINPITVKVWRKGYMIVSGERRWRAHKVAGIKTIQAVVKEYNDDGKFMIDSLIENIHREDLSPTEKGKFCLKIKKQMKLETNEAIAKILKYDARRVGEWIDDYNFNKSSPSIAGKSSSTLIKATRGMDNKEREKIIKFAEKGDMADWKIEKEFVPVYKKSDEPTKKALLSGKATIEDVKRESIPEPIQLEETANDILDNLISDMTNFKDNYSKLTTKMNIDTLSKSKLDVAMTRAGLHLKAFKDFVNMLRQRGAKPHPLILALIKANGKI